MPIPGSRRIDRVQSNAHAATAELDPAVVAELSELYPPGAAAGERYTPAGMARQDR